MFMAGKYLAYHFQFRNKGDTSWHSDTVQYFNKTSQGVGFKDSVPPALLSWKHQIIILLFLCKAIQNVEGIRTDYPGLLWKDIGYRGGQEGYKQGKLHVLTIYIAPEANLPRTSEPIPPGKSSVWMRGTCILGIATEICFLVRTQEAVK